MKYLVFYYLYDIAELRREQDELIIEVYHGCCKSSHELLLEVILPGSNADKYDSYYLEILQHFYLLGIKPDWWKLPPLSVDNWQQVSALIDANDPFCREVLILEQDASEETLKTSFASAAEDRWVKGFAIVRTIFGQLSRHWLQGELDAAAVIEQVKQQYLTLIGF